MSQWNGKKPVDGGGKIPDAMVMLQIAHLLALADEYQRIDPVEDKTLSYRVFADSKKLTALRTKSDITTGRFNAAVQWFSDHWPDGARWPLGVSRPRQSERAA